MGMKAALVARMQTSIPGAAWTDERISWGGFQRGDALPALALLTVSPGRGYTHDGHDGLDGPRVRFTVRAATIEEAEAIADAIVLEMETAADVIGTRFHPAQLIAERHNELVEEVGGQPAVEVQREMIFHHEEL